MIYFAYGSNLCFPRFVSRVPSAKLISVAKLPGARVVFHKRGDDGSGKATLVPEDGAEVYGALFSFEDGDLPGLRRAEGWPKHYDEKRVTVVTPHGTVEAMTYIATSCYYDAKQVPYDWYVDLIRYGARRVGLPEEYIARFDNVSGNKDTDATRARRERGFLR